MRPHHLVLENFASFRGRHEVDFSGVELFVLSGPTGAGKSSIIDAMTCALYGSIPRYDDERLIEPAIHKLATQAKVSFTFATGGATYVATRVLRRTPAGGAQAAEVRLERVRDDGTTAPLASGSRQVAAEVPRLLGLNFHEFCKTVVLPQGAFAQFLHGGRDERHRLLVHLLGLEIYQELGRLARSQEQRLAARIEAIDGQLTQHADVDERAVADAEAHARRLADVRRELAERAWPELEAARERAATGEREAEAAAATVKLLGKIAQPEGVTELSDRINAADKALAQAEQLVERRRGEWSETRKAEADAPDERPLSELLRVDEEFGKVAERGGDLAEQAERDGQAAEDAKEEAAKAQEALAEARAEVQRIEHANMAHTLAQGLEPGADCPVCRRAVEEVPSHPRPTGLAQAQKAVEQAERKAKRLDDHARKLDRKAHASKELLREARQRYGELRAQLQALAERCALPLVDGRADRDAAQARIAEAQRAANAARKAQKAFEQAERERDDARQARAALDNEAQAAWKTYTTTRDTVAHLGAPPATEGDLARSWAGLLDWRAVRLTAAEAEHGKVADALARAREEVATRTGAIVARAPEAGVEPPGEDAQAARDALAEAATRADGEAKALRERLLLVAELRDERAGHEEQRQVARLLGDLLRRDHFEQWLLGRLSSQLVAGASRILDELTQGAFSLDLDPQRGAFEVIDHLNADERRPARTLSGGETFLASLALALALAEHVAQVNRSGAARLDALFLDEGFGALDGETLDVVATAIEELAGSRMVGIITHVRELAARIPVRFDVHRGPDGSTIRLAGPAETAALDDLAEAVP